MFLILPSNQTAFLADHRLPGLIPLAMLARPILTLPTLVLEGPFEAWVVYITSPCPSKS